MLFVSGLTGLGLFAWLAVQVYRAKTDAAHFDGWDAWLLGPSPSALNDAARRRIEEGFAKLNDRALSAADRIEAYRESLASADRLLTRSLRAQPAQAWTLAKVAAVRWELAPPVGQEAMQGHLELIRLASAMAPTDPDVQRDLGKLLLLTGRRDEGSTYLRRAAELNPATARAIVELMVDFGFDPREMLETLPRAPETLVALRAPFLEAGREEEYLEILVPDLASVGTDPAVLRSFGETCLRLGQSQRLLEALERLGPFEDPDAEAERLLQVAWALLDLDDDAAALRHADLARELRPEIERYHDQAGAIAARAGRPEIAIEAFRRALAIAARNAESAERRAILYRKIGQALDVQGSSDQAYDAYKRALALDPLEPYAARRVREMEDAAGVRR